MGVGGGGVERGRVGFKKQKCFNACPEQGLVGSRAAQSCQTTATEMAVAGRKVPEIRCAVLHTDPRQVSPRLTGGKERTDLTNQHRIRDV